ncbi:MAG: hypothetical protein JOS17DRAFT_449360 [Linnemannia elongata]|nr:MAG: hypothetical protein JOS17DRAFT_449360 [Linnemannia elongata]
MCNDTVASQGLCDFFCGFLYDDGYTQGSEEGHSKGFEEGHAKGFEEGHSKSFDEGYSKGFDVGFLKGSDDGFAKGYEAGYKSGHDKGYYKGLYDADYPISYLINNQVLVIENVLFCILLICFWRKWNMRYKHVGYERI